MRFGHKLILFALICSALPLLGMTTLAFDAARSALGDIVEKDLESIAAKELEDLQDKLRDARGHLVTWASLGIMQDVMVDDSEGDIQAEIVRLGSRYPMFSELLIINSTGLVVASTVIDVNANDYRNHHEYDLPATEINYQGLVEYSNRVSREVVTYSIPILANYNESTQIGTLVGLVDWSNIKTDLTNRNVFGGPQDEQRIVVLTSVTNNKVIYSTNEKQLSDEFIAAVVSDTGVREIQIDDSDYVVASVRSSALEDFRDSQWSMHVVLDTDVAFSSAKQLLNYMLVIGAAAFLLVSIFGTLLAREIVKPINALVIGAKGLASGDYHSPIPPYTIKDEIGDLTQSFTAMRDAIKMNEQELIKRTKISEEAARLKGEFLANMSHEVRTPINGVLGMTELLLNTELDDTQNRYASTISRSGQSLLSVINDILDFSKIEAGKLELQDSAFDLRELVEDVVELVAESAHRKHIEISAYLSPDAHVAYQGDASRLRQILINLLGNAIKFTSEGEVTLSVTTQDNSANATGLRFEVTDTGIGIATKAQSSIFESFVQADGTTTRKYGGSGLGLAISAQLAELMNGEIGVNSELGKGSTFWFTANVGKLSSMVEDAWLDNHALKGKRIIIVDDNKTNREILQAQVEYWGANYYLAESGQQALIALREASNQNNPYDLAILDMHMPEMDGLALTVAIKSDKTLLSTRLILLSSVCDELDIASYRAIGLESVLTKPVRQPELYQCLAAVMANIKIELKPQPKSIHKLDLTPLSGYVLIAEDNPVNQELIGEIMSLMGVNYYLVENGQEALDALSKERFDAVLMDCQMPIMGGFEATRKIRENEKTQSSSNPIPIIALTANALQGDRETCLAAGMDEYLSKPVSTKQVHAMLSRWLRESVDEPETSHVQEESAIANHVTTVEVFAEPEPEDVDVDVDTAPLDSVAFSEIRAISAQASSGFLTRLTNKFIDNSASDIEKLTEKLNVEQPEDIRQLAHSLKSSSANMGAQRLARQCQVLESAAAANDLANMVAQLDDIKRERERVVEALSVECQRAA